MQDLYFKDEMSKYVFYLIQLHGTGKTQLDFLGINIVHYYNKNIARIWYIKIKSILENGEHSQKELALELLDGLYKNMKH
ncbi:hypothetical protein [Fusobacterium necrophorum]|uniref:hypothetical protein n=1 Tax=Fusobacterium necrophorum TaxID=859 RepID=UPI0024308C98|nr:hypothetical protein [Fusobacterium necrophorum]